VPEPVAIQVVAEDRRCRHSFDRAVWRQLRQNNAMRADSGTGSVHAAAACVAGGCSGLFALIGLIACTPRAAVIPHRPVDPAAGVADTQPGTGAFSELNALARQAATLKTPLARYAFYRSRQEQSHGPMRALIAQVLAATEAELGAYEQALQQYPQGAPILRGTPAALPDPARFEARDAADAIAGLARDRRILMVNEAHHAAQTRALTLALLPRLRALGFTHFAAEGLDERDRNLAARGYPTKASGPYIDEPLYGEIIRSALRLGFVVVPYESPGADAQQREEGQAQHLVERVFRQRSDARLFVHAGYAHVHKRADYLDSDTMAMRLARKIGIDPLVVDQTVLRPGAPGREFGGYRALLQSYPIRTATVFTTPDGTAWSLEPRVYDISVLLPPSRLIEGRPDWLTLDGERGPVAIAIDLQAISLPCVIEARHANENEDAVPADRLLLERGNGIAVLFLRGGDYRVEAVAANGRVITTQRLHVDAPAPPH
jgi:hypothetical protein